MLFEGVNTKKMQFRNELRALVGHRSWRGLQESDITHWSASRIEIEN